MTPAFQALMAACAGKGPDAAMFEEREPGPLGVCIGLVLRLHGLERRAWWFSLAHMIMTGLAVTSAALLAWRPASALGLVASMLHMALTGWLGFNAVRSVDLWRSIQREVAAAEGLAMEVWGHA